MIDKKDIVSLASVLLAITALILVCILILSALFFPLRLYFTGNTEIENVSKIKETSELVAASREMMIPTPATAVITQQGTTFTVHQPKDTTFHVNEPVFIMSSRWLKKRIYVPVAKPSLFQVISYQDGIYYRSIIGIAVLYFSIGILLCFPASIICFYFVLTKRKCKQVHEDITANEHSSSKLFIVSLYVKKISPFIINAILLNLIGYLILVSIFSIENVTEYFAGTILFLDILAIFLCPLIYRGIKKLLSTQTSFATFSNSVINSVVPLFAIYKLIKFINDTPLTSFKSFFELFVSFLKTL